MFKLTLSEQAKLTVKLNEVRGGVVLTNPDVPAVVDLSGATGIAIASSPELPAAVRSDYAEWIAVGKPQCWTFPRQCHGDADGLQEGNAKTGYYYVGPNDLNILIAAWQVKEPPLGPGIATVANGICMTSLTIRLAVPRPASIASVPRTSTASSRIGWLKSPRQAPACPAIAAPSCNLSTVHQRQILTDPENPIRFGDGDGICSRDGPVR